MRAVKRDTREQIEVLLDRFEPRLRAAFRDAVDRIRGSRTLNEIAALIAAGRTDEALELAESSIRVFADLATEAYILAGRDVALMISNFLGDIVSFDAYNVRAVENIRQATLSTIVEFTREQRDAVRTALLIGTRRGLNPRTQARLFREAIGLTAHQVRIVENYRQLLEANSRDALNRALRDRRYDARFRRAIREGTALRAEDIAPMVDRYRARMLRRRSEDIARTAALQAVHQGAEEGLRQSVEGGLIEVDWILRTWNTRLDGRQRDSHGTMNKQKRRYGQPFMSGAGNPLKYPGDPSAPASDRLRCRCVVTTRLRR